MPPHNPPVMALARSGGGKPWASVHNLFRALFGRVDTIQAELRALAREPGPQGIAGRDGTDGRDGRGVSRLWIEDCVLRAQFTDGTDRALGPVVGKNGTDGASGNDGRGVVRVSVESGVLRCEYSDGVVVDAGSVVGPKGEDGADGKDGVDAAGITTAALDASGCLLLSLTDGRTLNLGAVRGQDGRDGRDVDPALIASMQARIDDLTKEIAALRSVPTGDDPEFAARVQSLLGAA